MTAAPDLLTQPPSRKDAASGASFRAPLEPSPFYRAGEARLTIVPSKFTQEPALRRAAMCGFRDKPPLRDLNEYRELWTEAHARER